MARTVSARSCWFLASTETIRTGPIPLSGGSTWSLTNQISPRLGSRFVGIPFYFRFLLQLRNGELRPSFLLSFLSGGETEKLAADVSPNPFHQTLIFAGLGDKERTLEALDRMTELGPLRIGRILTFPELALVRGDPRLKAIRRKVGSPE